MPTVPLTILLASAPAAPAAAAEPAPADARSGFTLRISAGVGAVVAGDGEGIGVGPTSGVAIGWFLTPAVALLYEGQLTMTDDGLTGLGGGVGVQLWPSRLVCLQAAVGAHLRYDPPLGGGDGGPGLRLGIAFHAIEIAGRHGLQLGADTTVGRYGGTSPATFAFTVAWQLL